MAGNSELEIKLAVSDMRLFDIILSDPQILELSQGNVAETRNFEALYYDTASFALQRQGISYRVRREGQEWVATLKSDRSSGGGEFDRERRARPGHRLTAIRHLARATRARITARRPSPAGARPVPRSTGGC